MRDPSRIQIILEALRKEWESHPDLRLCQLISNITRDGDGICIINRDLFNVEDTEFMRQLNEWSVKYGSYAPKNR